MNTCKMITCGRRGVGETLNGSSESYISQEPVQNNEPNEVVSEPTTKGGNIDNQNYDNEHDVDDPVTHALLRDL